MLSMKFGISRGTYFNVTEAQTGSWGLYMNNEHNEK